MLVYLLCALALSGGATWTVLNGSVSASPRRNRRLAGWLLAATAAVWLAGLLPVVFGLT
ncbi:hypothetical protein J2S43_004558 [Catenuloplanes nepalensis]|uniref:Uncharacterized protein n=1 Tax=Catenuloplanes nepalensis TaxID=587533 RepID=A0ABT9MX81_9ACTN|nr:hypothetical protein [Catenuloplanes nepalensis]MDP9796046.1 hypothetical protein [Catenuloplanes nepalensis]